jgi:hypothetical protein
LEQQACAGFARQRNPEMIKRDLHGAANVGVLAVVA